MSIYEGVAKASGETYAVENDETADDASGSSSSFD
jgi:hypothetical protein